MAQLERIVRGDFDRTLSVIENGILNGSVSATLEGSSDFRNNGARVAVRVFERYSMLGDNRVSMNVTLFEAVENEIMLSAITAGGSQAVFFKVNTMGEESFLEKLEEILDRL